MLFAGWENLTSHLCGGGGGIVLTKCNNSIIINNAYKRSCNGNI